MLKLQIYRREGGAEVVTRRFNLEDFQDWEIDEVIHFLELIYILKV